ncbi:MAG: response regulator [Pseudomonadota bacterium]
MVESFLIFLFLTAGGWLGNYFKLPLFFNVDFLFGGVFTFLVFFLLPPWWGVLSAALAGGYTIILWNHPYALVIIIGEAAFAGYLFRKKSTNLVLLDLIYWLFLGMPLVWLFYHEVMGMDAAAVLVVMIKQGVNGVFNALLASVIAYSVAASPLAPTRDRGRLTYRNLLFVIMVSLVLFPALAGMVVSNRRESRQAEDDIRQKLNQKALSQREYISAWLAGTQGEVVLLAELYDSFGEMGEERIKLAVRAVLESNPSFLRLGICDADGVLVLAYPEDRSGRSARPGSVVLSGAFLDDLRRGDGPLFSEPMFSAIDLGAPVMIVAAPLKATAGRRGFAFGFASLEKASLLMKEFIRFSGGCATLINDRGLVVAGTKLGVFSGSAFERLSDGSAQVTAGGLKYFSREIGPNMSVMQRWKDSFFYDLAPLGPENKWSLIVETPVGPYRDLLFVLNRNRMLLMMGLIILTVAASHVLSRRLVRSLANIQKLSTKLPEAISSGGPETTWPESAIFEVNSLIGNFKTMSVMLKEKFAELREANLDLRVAKEAAEAANKAKSEFLAVMSHEIRTPMNAIISLTEIALQNQLDDDLRDQLETVYDSAGHLLDLLKGILDFSKIEAGKIDLEETDFLIRPLVESVARALKSQAGKKGLQLQLKVDDRVPEALKGDPLRLKQVLTNLVGNAVKFTSQGVVGIQVAPVEGAPASGGGERVGLLFTVVDTGPGLAPGAEEFIFEAFRQADSSTSRRFGGAGLGLAISQRLVVLMGGRIWVEKRPGWGGVFCFSAFFLPGDAAAAWRLDSRSSLSQNETASAGVARVLLVEDNPVNIKVASLALTRMNHQVVSVDRGALALVALAEQSFDLVLLDLEMPDMDGFETARRIRAGEAGERNKNIPIAAVTAHALSFYKHKAAEAGMNGFVTKPFSLAELETVVQSILATSREQQTCSPPPDGEPRETPAINWEAALENVDGDMEMLQELFKIFLDDLAGRIQGSKTALDGERWDEIAYLAHSMKGSAAAVGAESCRDLAVCLEKASREGRKEEARRRLTELENEYRRLEALIVPREA